MSDHLTDDEIDELRDYIYHATPSRYWDLFKPLIAERTILLAENAKLRELAETFCKLLDLGFGDWHDRVTGEQLELINEVESAAKQPQQEQKS